MSTSDFGEKSPVIGLTCHHVAVPGRRSAVGQLYVDAIASAGGVPIAIPPNLAGETLEAVYDLLDAVLLPGGGDVAPDRYGHEPHPRLGPVDPERDDLELTIARWALRDDRPILGICRGIQVMAVAAGGTLFQDLPTELPSELSHDSDPDSLDFLAHTVEFLGGSRVAEWLGGGNYLVNSFHHQSVRDVPSEFMVTARANDGVVEAIEHRRHSFAVGVQCHPERMWQTTAPEYAGLFRAFVTAAAAAGSRARRSA